MVMDVFLPLIRRPARLKPSKVRRMVRPLDEEAALAPLSDQRQELPPEANPSKEQAPEQKTETEPAAKKSSNHKLDIYI